MDITIAHYFFMGTGGIFLREEFVNKLNERSPRIQVLCNYLGIIIEFHSILQTMKQSERTQHSTLLHKKQCHFLTYFVFSSFTNYLYAFY